MSNYESDWDDMGTPICTEKCPKHDGKRCGILGYRPGKICEPAVRDLNADYRKQYEGACRRAIKASIERDEAIARAKKKAKARERKLWACLNAIYAPDFDSLPMPIPGCGQAVRNEDIDALCKALRIEEDEK